MDYKIIIMNFEKKNIESQKVAFIKHIGRVEEMDKFGDIMEWISKNNIQIVGVPFSIYYTDPSMVNPDENVFDMAVPIAGEVEGTEEIKIKELPACTVISTIHKGSYSNLHEAYKGVWDYMMENKYEMSGVPLEIYLNNPQDVPEEELLTEIQFPIKE